MSHANGEVWTPDGKLIGCFEYNGTCNIACTHIFKTAQELGDNWRTPNNCKECTCPRPHTTPVILYTTYGNGYWWPAKACLECGALIVDLIPFEYENNGSCNTCDGHPFPEAEQVRKQFWKRPNDDFKSI